MKCNQVQQYLSEYMDGELDEAIEAAVQEHLERCGTCAAELEKLRAVVWGIRGLPRAEPPADFLGQLHERMERRGRLKQALEKMFVPFRIKVPLQAAAAGAVAVLVFLVMQTPQMQREIEQGPAKMQVQERAEEVQAPDVQADGQSVPPPDADAALDAGTAGAPAVEKEAGDMVTQADREKTPAPSAPVQERAGEAWTAVERSVRKDKGITGPAAGKMKALKTAPEKVREEAAPAGKASAPAERRSPAPVTGQAGTAKGPVVGAQRARPERDGRSRADGRKLSPRARGRAGEDRALRHAARPDASSVKEGKRYAADKAAGRDHPAVKKVTGLVEKVSGRVVSVDYTEGAAAPGTMTADIPADRYERFRKALEKAGTGHVTGTSPEGPSLVRVRISLSGG